MFVKNPNLIFNNNNKNFIFHDVIYHDPSGIINYDYINNYFQSFDTNKINIIFLLSDLLFYRNCLEHIKLFCTSNEGQSKNVFTFPYFLEPINETYQPINHDKPVVSFCGFISHISRLICIQELYKHNFIEKNFIIRDKFWAGKPHDITVVNEYRNNIKNSHFVLCNRGAGNYSMRFYHALESGRIPIIFKPSCVLPFNKNIDYSKYIVIANDESDMIKKIMQIWHSGDIINRQQMCSELYKEWFLPKSFEEKVIETIHQY